MTDYLDEFEEFGAATPDATQLKSIEELVTRAAELSRIIEQLEESLAAHKKELQELTHKTLPDSMSEAGTLSFTTTAGVKVQIKDVVAGSLPKDDVKRTLALNWIEKNGGKDIIKSQLVCDFEKGDGNLRKKNQAAELLADMGVTFVDKESVHPKTLEAFAREKIRNGEELPAEMLGLYLGRMAKITKV